MKQNSSEEMKASAAVLGAGILWGTSCLFVRKMSDLGMTSEMQTAFKMLLTGAFYWILLLSRDRNKLKIRVKDCWIFALAGLFSMSVFTYLHYYTLIHGQASVTIALIYTSPVFVMLLSALFFKERITREKITAVLLAVLGCALTAGFFSEAYRTPPLIAAASIFAGSGALLFTHLHKDHYDEASVNEYLRQHPDSAVWGPGLTGRGLSDIRNEDGRCSFRYGDFRIEAYETKHSGPKYMKVPHYSLLVHNTIADEVFFAAGDAVPEPDLGCSIRREYGGCTGGIYAFVMAYQLAEKKSRHFLEELKPARIFLIHQPREEDQAYRMVSHIMKYAIRETPDGVTVETPAPMTWIE